MQIIVVDNASTDRTAELAQSAGATVVHEAERNIARVRNAGAANASHDVLIFLDADTLVPTELLARIARIMADPMCIGGAVDSLHRSNSLIVRAYLKFWRILGFMGGMAQGACQYCRKSVFQELDGYDETWYLGEDVDFYLCLKRHARQRGLQTCLIRDLQVMPSPRRRNNLGNAYPLRMQSESSNKLSEESGDHRRNRRRAQHLDPGLFDSCR